MTGAAASPEELAASIASTVADYRESEVDRITTEHVLTWAQQFDSRDVLAVLRETDAILKKRYFSRDDGEHFLRKVIEKFAAKYAEGSVARLVGETAFLDLQEGGKSQGAMLEMLDTVMSGYGVSITECGKDGPRRCVYLDDVLCTGNTLFYDMRAWWLEPDESGTPRYAVLPKEVGVEYVFIALHEMNWFKVRARLRMDGDLPPRAVPQWAWRGIAIENDFTRAGAALDFAFPRRAGVSAEAEAYFTSLGVSPDGVFRTDGRPATETLFTTPEGRDQFERAILSKGIELINSVTSKKENIRPLGFTLPSHKTLGFGALVFTWRNVPNNAPLVFWYDTPGFTPLFDKRPSVSEFFT